MHGGFNFRTWRHTPRSLLAWVDNTMCDWSWETPQSLIPSTGTSLMFNWKSLHPRYSHLIHFWLNQAIHSFKLSVYSFKQILFLIESNSNSFACFSPSKFLNQRWSITSRSRRLFINSVCRKPVRQTSPPTCLPCSAPRRSWWSSLP